MMKEKNNVVNPIVPVIREYLSFLVFVLLKGFLNIELTSLQRKMYNIIAIIFVEIKQE